MDLGLKNKLALVSGSTAGIGLAIATTLAREGAEVVVNGRTQKRVDEALSTIRKDVPAAKLRGIAADLSKADGVKQLLAAVPTVDVLVNNLGIFEIKKFEEITDEDWQRFFDANVMSGVRLSRAYLPGMKKKNWGRILFISSESGLNTPAEMVHYGFTKSAQLAVARGLAGTVAGTKITVNSVLPGPTRSEGLEAFMKQSGKDAASAEREFFQTARPTSLIKRFAEPEEVASMVAYLCSELASATTGAALRVDGGVVNSIG